MENDPYSGIGDGAATAERPASMRPDYIPALTQLLQGYRGQSFGAENYPAVADLPPIAAPTPKDYTDTDDFKKLSNEEQERVIREHVRADKAADRSLDAKPEDELVEAVKKQVTAKYIMDNAILGPTARGLIAARNSIGEPVTHGLEAIGVPKRGAELVGGLTGGVVDMGVAGVAAAGAGLISKNPGAALAAFDTTMGLTQALTELAETGDKGNAATLLATSIAAPAIGNKVAGIPAKAYAGMSPVTPKQILLRGAAEGAVNALGMGSVAETDQQKGESIAIALAMTLAGTAASYKGVRVAAEKAEAVKFNEQRLQSEAILAAQKAVQEETTPSVTPHTPRMVKFLDTVEGLQTEWANKTEMAYKETAHLKPKEQRKAMYEMRDEFQKNLLKASDEAHQDLSAMKRTMEDMAKEGKAPSMDFIKEYEIQNVTADAIAKYRRGEINDAQFNRELRDARSLLNPEEVQAKQAKINAEGTKVGSDNARAAEQPSMFEIQTNDEYSMIRATHDVFGRSREEQGLPPLSPAEKGLATKRINNLKKAPKAVQELTEVLGPPAPREVAKAVSTVETPAPVAALTEALGTPMKPKAKVRAEAVVRKIEKEQTESQKTGATREVVDAKYQKQINDAKLPAPLLSELTERAKTDKTIGDPKTALHRAAATILEKTATIADGFQSGGRGGDVTIAAQRRATRKIASMIEKGQHKELLDPAVQARIAAQEASHGLSDFNAESTRGGARSGKETGIVDEATGTVHYLDESGRERVTEVSTPADIKISKDAPISEAQAKWDANLEWYKDYYEKINKAKTPEEKRALIAARDAWVEEHKMEMADLFAAKNRGELTRKVEKMTENDATTIADNVLAETVFNGWGFKLKEVTTAELKAAFPDLKDHTSINGMVHSDSKTIYVVKTDNVESMLRTFRHEFGHIIYNPKDAAKILANFSEKELTKLYGEYGAKSYAHLAEEIFAESTSRVLDRELTRVSAPLLKRVVYGVMDFLERMGIDTMKMTTKAGYAADMKVSVGLRELIFDAKHAAMEYAARDKYFASSLGQDEGVRYSRKQATTGSITDEIAARDAKNQFGKVSPADVARTLLTNSAAHFDTSLSKLYKIMRGVDSNLTLTDLTTMVRATSERGGAAADQMLYDARAGKLIEVDHMLKNKNPTGMDVREDYGRWAYYKAYVDQLAPTEKTITLSDGKQFKRDTKGIKPYTINGKDFTLEMARKAVEEIEGRMGSKTVEFFEQMAQREQMFYTDVLKKMEDSGLISRDQRLKTEGTPYFAPMMDNSGVPQLQKYSKTFDVSATNPINRLTGGKEWPKLNYDRMQVATLHAQRMMQMAEQNLTMREIGNLTHFTSKTGIRIDELKMNLKKQGLTEEQINAHPELANMRTAKAAVEGVIKHVKANEKGDLPEVERHYSRRHAWVDGELQRYDIFAPMAQAMDSMSPQEMNILLKAASIPSGIVRLFATSTNLSFALRNPVRDILDTMVKNPGNIGMGFLRQMPSAVSETVKYVLGRKFGMDFSDNITSKMGDFLEAQKQGAYAGTQFMETKGFVERIQDLIPGQARKREVMVTPSKWKRFATLVMAPSEITELAVRLSVFKELKAKGYAAQEAGFMSRNILDYTRSGTLSRDMNAVVPFFNARIQGMSAFAQAFQALVHPKATLEQRAAAGMRLAWTGVMVELALAGASAGYAAMTGNGAGVLAASDGDWQKNFLFPTGKITLPNGETAYNYFKIPKPETFQVMFNGVEGMIRESLKSKLTLAKAIKIEGEALLQAVSPINLVNGKNFTTTQNLMYSTAQLGGPTALAIAQYMANKDFYTGRNIVPRSQEKWNPEDQYRDSTLHMFRYLGALSGQSPAQLEAGFKAMGLTGIPLKVMTIAERATMPQGPGASTVGQEIAKATGFVGRGGYADVTDKLQGEAFNSVNESYQKQAAQFNREFNRAMASAYAGDTTDLKNLKREYKKLGMKDRVSTVETGLRNAKMGQDLLADNLLTMSAPMRAAAILQYEQTLPSGQTHAFLRNLQKRKVMTDEVSANYRRYKKFIAQGHDFSELGQALKGAPH